MNIEEAKKELLGIKKDNESKAMIINNNSSNMQIRWSNKDLKEMAEISQRCAREIRAIEIVLSELEKKDKVIDEMSKYVNSPLRIPEEKYCELYHSDEDCCWKTDKDCKDCIKEYFTNKVEREGK